MLKSNFHKKKHLKGEYIYENFGFGQVCGFFLFIFHYGLVFIFNQLMVAAILDLTTVSTNPNLIMDHLRKTFYNVTVHNSITSVK